MYTICYLSHLFKNVSTACIRLCLFMLQVYTQYSVYSICIYTIYIYLITFHPSAYWYHGLWSVYKGQVTILPSQPIISSHIKGVHENQTCQCVFYSPIFISSPTPTSRVSMKTRPASVCFTVFTYIYFFTYSDIKGVQENQTCQGVSIIILVDLFLHLLRNQRCPENQISKKVFIRKLKIRSTPPPPTVH